MYQRYSKSLYLYIYSLTKNKELTEDLCQETFLRALLSFEASEEAFLPWLFRVSKNLYIDYLRKAGKSDITDFQQMDIPYEENFMEGIIAQERKRRVFYELEKLNERERIVTLLYYYGGLKQEEIARELGISFSTLRGLLRRVRLKLYQELKEEKNEL